MAGGLIARKRTIQSRSKVRTGCTTCRIRKVKCDENQPFCQKCVGTGRTCDGYESPFRIVSSQPTNPGKASVTKSGAFVQPIPPTLPEISPQDIDLLNRCFSTKTVFDVKLDCDEEAREVLQSSLTDPSIQHAVSSLRALREIFETSREVPAPVVQLIPSYDYGIQQYCMALGSLASNLAMPGSHRLKSALLCCQIFISIEQMRQNYGAMAQHITQGLRIMHDYRARPTLDATNVLVPAYHDQLPFLDVFIIKLFAAPCKFAEPTATANIDGTTTPVCPISPHGQPVESRDFRRIVPDLQTELTRIATSTLKFLDKLSHVKSAENALRLLSNRLSLLDSLESWTLKLDLTYTEISALGPEPISVSFLRLFHQVLKLVLLGALDSSTDLYARLQIENNRLQDIAIKLGERLESYRMD